MEGEEVHMPGPLRDEEFSAVSRAPDRGRWLAAGSGGGSAESDHGTDDFRLAIWS
jgi:hypothetical protein